MSERSRVGLILGAVGVVAVGSLIYVFKVHMPNKERAAARAEIEAWEKRVTEARTCLLGEKPASGDSAEALSVRELQPDPWNRGTCTRLIGQLNRGPANDSGIMPVERAWMEVERAASRVATSFATHVDPFGEPRAERHKESPLPQALLELDKAHADLRAAAGMSPPASSALAKLPAAESIVVRPGAAKLRWDDSALIPSAGGAVMFGRVADEGAVQVVLAPGAAPKLAKLTGSVVRAVPDLAWGATTVGTQLVIGTLDEASAFVTQSELSTKEPAQVVAIAGKSTEGVVVFGAGKEVGFARASGGASFAISGAPITSVYRLAAAVDLAGRAALAWTLDDGSLAGVILADGGEPKVLPLGSGDTHASSAVACLTKQHAWAGDDPQFVRFDNAAAQPHVLPGFRLEACSETSALLQKPGTVELAVCGEACRTVTVPRVRYASAVGLVGDKALAFRAHRGVLGVWREDGTSLFYSYPGITFLPLLAHSDGKVIDLVGTLDEQATILRIPVR